MALMTNSPQTEAPDNLYTTLLIISAVTLLIGIVAVVYRSIEFFGSIWPKGTTG